MPRAGSFLAVLYAPDRICCFLFVYMAVRRPPLTRLARFRNAGIVPAGLNPSARGYLCCRMIISYQWLLEYLPRPLPVEELSHILTSIGLEVEAVEKTEAVKGGLE